MTVFTKPQISDSAVKEMAVNIRFLLYASGRSATDPLDEHLPNESQQEETL